MSPVFRKSQRKQLGLFASLKAILDVERGGRCVWHRSMNWENGKAFSYRCRCKAKRQVGQDKS